MRAQLNDIQTNDYRSWEEFESADIADPYDHFGWFTLAIGGDEMTGSELFQVVVTTPTAIQRAKRSAASLCQQGAKFQGIVVPVFEPALVRETLETFVAGISGWYWDDIRERLRKSMFSEYG